MTLGMPGIWGMNVRCCVIKTVEVMNDTIFFNRRYSLVSDWQWGLIQSEIKLI